MSPQSHFRSERPRPAGRKNLAREMHGGWVLRLENVSFNYHTKKKLFDNGLHHVLDSVCLRVFEGETLGVIGRNGVGKTTILRIMAGIIKPTSGLVTIKKDKSVAMLTLGLGFRPDLSGRDNALLAAMLQGSTVNEARSFLEEIKTFSELGDSFEEPVKTYSTGMRARLGFTTALKTRVDILLIDEVLSVGDAAFREKTRMAITHKVRGDQTVVIVSHAQAQLRDLCDRLIWIEKGRIVEKGPPKRVLKAYNSYYVDSSNAQAQAEQRRAELRSAKPQ